MATQDQQQHASHQDEQHPPQPRRQIAQDDADRDTIDKRTDKPRGPPSPPRPSPSPSPSPATTTPTASVAAGPRAQRLQAMFELALGRTAGRLSLANLAACYPTVGARAPWVLQQVQRAVVERFGRLCADEFARTLAARGVVARLNELEALVAAADQRRRRHHHHHHHHHHHAASASAGASAAGESAEAEAAEAAEIAEAAEAAEIAETAEAESPPPPPAPPHLLPADTVLAAHLAPHLASQQSQLNARLQNTQAANVVLWDEIQAQRDEFADLLAGLERAVADVDGAAGLLDELPADELSREARAVEADMADMADI